MYDTELELQEKLTRLQWLLRQQQMTEMAEHGPFADTSRGQGRVLALLKMQPEISTKDLAYLLNIRQQSLNELLNRLEKGGYVERKPSANDRRVLMVQLTEKGKTVQQPRNNYADIFDCLEEKEQKIFGIYLDRIIAALEQKLGITAQELEEWGNRMRNAQLERLMQMRAGTMPGWQFGQETTTCGQPFAQDGNITATSDAAAEKKTESQEGLC